MCGFFGPIYMVWARAPWLSEKKKKKEKKMKNEKVRAACASEAQPISILICEFPGTRSLHIFPATKPFSLIKENLAEKRK